MKFLYRPHRGTLADAMEEVKEFDTYEEMLDYIQKEHKIGKNFAFNKEEIRIAYYGYDSRIDWETYIVTVDRYFNDDYLKKHHYPQAIGFMTFKYGE